MAKRGRPPKPNPEPASKHIRVKPDLYEMIRWICKVDGVDAADVVDPLLREAIEEQYLGVYGLARKMKQREDARKLADGEPASPPLHQLNTIDPVTGEMVTLEELARREEERAAALFALTPDAFTWKGRVPASVYSLARSQKAGQAHGIPLNPDAARLLAPWLKARPAGVPLFRRPAGSRLRTAAMLRFDLAAAGIPYKDAAGQQFDFHSLRVQFGVMLALAGVSLVAAQQLMQHSTPVLTANIYSRVGGELAGEVAKLPPLGASLGATGFPPVPSGRKAVDKKTGGKTKKPQRMG